MLGSISAAQSTSSRIKYLPPPFPRFFFNTHLNGMTRCWYRVMVLNGPFRGTPAELVSIDVDKFQARVKVVADGKPRELSFEYEDICKVKS